VDGPDRGRRLQLVRHSDSVAPHDPDEAARVLVARAVDDNRAGNPTDLRECVSLPWAGELDWYCPGLADHVLRLAPPPLLEVWEGAGRSRLDDLWERLKAQLAGPPLPDEAFAPPIPRVLHRGVKADGFERDRVILRKLELTQSREVERWAREERRPQARGE